MKFHKYYYNKTIKGNHCLITTSNRINKQGHGNSLLLPPTYKIEYEYPCQ